MDTHTPTCGELLPLPYHLAVVDYLRQHEPDVWRWANELTTRREQLASLRTALLRETYRIDAQAHADVHEALKLAMQRLGMPNMPATLYQAPGQDMNASLVYEADEIHIVLQGPLLERLSTAELLAVFGHELSHHLLWSREDGCFLAADRILHEAQASAAGRDSHRETYRRYVLHTELFADRGGAIAAGSTTPAIATLVKVQTGMGTVDADAYLRQAIEIETQEPGASAALTHPETFIRARALALWWERANGLEAWVDARLHGPLSLRRLDLPGQLRLQALTRGFLNHYLTGTALASPAVQAQIRQLFPDWQADEPGLTADELAALDICDDVRQYFNALMLDLALADTEQQQAALLRTGQVARTLGSFDALQSNLRRDAGLGKRELDRYLRELDKEAKA